ncbi:MAG: pyridoxamine 5'-phosphate oxidase family protein [Pseudomonadota bacterium]
MPITTETDLRALYGEISVRAAEKVIDHIDSHMRGFIAHSPFMLLATSDGTNLDVSPKGDPAGAVIVEEDGRHVLLADRPGNNRIDGLLNILGHPSVAMLFVIPGVRETLRVNGHAEIHAEPEILDQCLINGRRPITVTRIRVEEAYLHCAKALIRSKLWQPETWPKDRPVTTMGEMLRDHTGQDIAYETDEAMVARYAKQLY